MAFLCGGCGTHVPDMTLSTDPYATPNLLLSVITHIKAELECAVVNLYTQDQSDSKAKHVPPTLSWLATGAGKATITLTADEKSIFNPTAIYTENFPTAGTGVSWLPAVRPSPLAGAPRGRPRSTSHSGLPRPWT